MRMVIALSLMLAVPAMAVNLSWSEDFNSYDGGATDWDWNTGVSGSPDPALNGWTSPSVSTNLDGYLPSGGSGLSPRMGNLYNFCTTDLGGGTYGATATVDVVLTYKAGFSRGNAESEQVTPGSDFIALGTAAGIAAIPSYADQVANGPLTTAIDAIAFGHQNALTRHYWFDGKEWIRWGTYSQAVPYSNDMRYGTGAVTVTMKANGDVTWSSAPMGNFAGTHQVPGLAFTNLALSHENAAPAGSAPASYDDLGVVAAPEPATLTFLALGGLALLRRRR